MGKERQASELGKNAKSLRELESGVKEEVPAVRAPREQQTPFGLEGEALERYLAFQARGGNHGR